VFKKAIFSFSAASVLVLSGCASQPTDIQAQSVSTVQYEQYNCTQVAGEMGRVNDRITTLHAQLKRMADNDAAAMTVGMVIFWPALFMLEGGDGAEAAEYGRLRGEMDALQKVGVTKSCADLPDFEDPIQLELAAKAKAEHSGPSIH